MSARVLVTGGAGFIGSHTVNFLLDQGVQVVVLDNLSSGKLTNLNLQHPNLEFVEGDILEYPFVVDLISETDAVLHLAAIASVPLSIENPIYTWQVNMQGLLHVLEAIRKVQRPIRLVYASSAAVYGDATHMPCRDDLPLVGKPLSPYALQKIDNEAYADLYQRLHAIPSLALRYFNVYGPGQDPHSPYSGVISRFIAGCQQQQTLTIFGDGLQSRDFIHVSDIVRANWLALQSDYAGVLNVATGKPETLLDLLGYIQAECAEKVNYHHVEARAGDIHASYGAVVLAKEKLDFVATVALKDGVKSLLPQGNRAVG